MKQIYSIVLIFSFFTTIECMQSKNESVESKICPLLKQISPTAPSADYLNLATLLKKNNLSTCACTKFLLAAKQEKAINEFKKEWNIPEDTWKRANQIIKIIESEDKKNSKRMGLSSFPDYLPDSIVDQINTVMAKNFTYDLNFYVKFGKSTGVIRYLDYETIRRNADGSIKRGPKTSPHLLFLDSLLFKLSPEGRRGAIEHEIQHIKSNHGTLLEIMLTCVFSKYLNNSYTSTRFLQSSSRAQVARSFEAQADREPAACKDYSTAQDFVATFKELKNIVGCVRKGDHPSLQKRIDWAVRLSNLKKAEEQLSGKN